MSNTFRLHSLTEVFAICKLPPANPIPKWATMGETWSVTRTPTELSCVCPEGNVPPTIRAERDWRALQVEGPLPFTMVGVLSSILDTLANDGISVFVLSTFDTDLILVRTEQFSEACARLNNAGHTIVEVRSSPIQGLGVFALAPYSAGQCIREITVVREITPEAPLREELGELADHCDYPDGRVVLLGFPDRHINHSCDPNAYVQYKQDHSFLCARRDITVGEEITCDYNMNITGGTSWPCHCGAARCRGETIGDFFKLPIGIQLEYQPQLAEWFVRRHQEALAQLISRRPV